MIAGYNELKSIISNDWLEMESKKLLDNMADFSYNMDMCITSRGTNPKYDSLFKELRTKSSTFKMSFKQIKNITDRKILNSLFLYAPIDIIKNGCVAEQYDTNIDKNILLKTWLLLLYIGSKMHSTPDSELTFTKTYIWNNIQTLSHIYYLHTYEFNYVINDLMVNNIEVGLPLFTTLINHTLVFQPIQTIHSGGILGRGAVISVNPILQKYLIHIKLSGRVLTDPFAMDLHDYVGIDYYVRLKGLYSNKKISNTSKNYYYEKSVYLGIKHLFDDKGRFIGEEN